MWFLCGDNIIKKNGDVRNNDACTFPTITIIMLTVSERSNFLMTKCELFSCVAFLNEITKGFFNEGSGKYVRAYRRNDNVDNASFAYHIFPLENSVKKRHSIRKSYSITSFAFKNGNYEKNKKMILK